MKTSRKLAAVLAVFAAGSVFYGSLPAQAAGIESAQSKVQVSRHHDGHRPPPEMHSHHWDVPPTPPPHHPEHFRHHVHRGPHPEHFRHHGRRHPAPPCR